MANNIIPRMKKRFIDQPRRSLTVCQGRETIGHIFEYSGQRFVAVLAGAEDDDNLGTYKTTTEAATAISDAVKSGVST